MYANPFVSDECMNVLEEDGELRGGRKILQLVCKCLAVSVLSFPHQLPLFDQVFVPGQHQNENKKSLFYII
jgi:hypothetical protein